MAISYHLVRRKDLCAGASEDATLYYGQVRVNQTISYEELCKEVAEHTLGTEADVAWIMDGLQIVMRRYLDKGNIVELEALGSFRMSAGAPGVDREEDFSPSSFRKGRIVYKPNHSLLEDLIYRIRYEKIKPLERGKPCDRPHAV